MPTCSAMQMARMATGETAHPVPREDPALEAKPASKGAKVADHTKNRAAQAVPTAMETLMAAMPTAPMAAKLTFDRETSLAMTAERGARV